MVGDGIVLSGLPPFREGAGFFLSSPPLLFSGTFFLGLVCEVFLLWC